MKRQNQELERASMIMGSQAALARAIGVHRASISAWKLRGIPPHRCVQIERVTLGLVSREQLRPDIFGGKAHTGMASLDPVARSQ